MTNSPTCAQTLEILEREEETSSYSSSIKMREVKHGITAPTGAGTSMLKSN